MKVSLERRMNEALQRVGLHGWEAAWVPDPDLPRRGEVKLEARVVVVYDVDESEAWSTFTHEVLEIKRRASERPWRLMIKALIGVIEEISYKEKEEYLDGLPDLLDALDELEVQQ